MAKGKDARVTVILECTCCVQNRVNKSVSRYITQKNRHNMPGRLELRKFCPFCYKHTIHGEIKKSIEPFTRVYVPALQPKEGENDILYIYILYRI